MTIVILKSVKSSCGLPRQMTPAVQASQCYNDNWRRLNFRCNTAQGGQGYSNAANKRGKIGGV